MASYPPPSDKFDFKNYNPDYFIGKEEDEQQIIENPEIELNSLLNSYVKRDGSNIMTGGLTTPAIQIFNDGSILFSDNTAQQTAFKLLDRQNISFNANKLSRITYDEDNEITDIQGSLKVKKIIFSDDSNKEQVIAFDTIKNNDVINTKQKTQGIEYDEDLTKTTINNSCYINSLSCGNINTTHLNNTNSNIQEQITALNNAYTVPIADIESNKIKTTGLSYIDDENLTKTTIINDNCYINNLSCGNFNTGHLQNTTSNIQEQINNNSNLLSGFESSETLRISQLTIDANLIIEPSCFVKFQDGEFQNHAFSDVLYDKLVNNTSYIDSNNLLSSTLVYDSGNDKILSDVLNETGIKLNDLETKTQNIENDSTGVLINNTLKVKNVIFDDNSAQITAFTGTHKNKIDKIEINSFNKISAQTIGLGDINDFELSKLEGIQDNIQSKIYELESKDSNLQFQIDKINSSFTLSNFETASTVTILGLTSLSSGSWYDGVKSWIVTAFNTEIDSLYHFNMQFKAANLNEVQVMNMRIRVVNEGTQQTLEAGYYNGLFLDNARSQQPDYYTTSQLYYKATSYLTVQVRIDVNYHFKAGSSTNFGIKLQVAKLN